jgi:hypothetical protein
VPFRGGETDEADDGGGDGGGMAWVDVPVWTDAEGVSAMGGGNEASMRSSPSPSGSELLVLPTSIGCDRLSSLCVFGRVCVCVCLFVCGVCVCVGLLWWCAHVGPLSNWNRFPLVKGHLRNSKISVLVVTIQLPYRQQTGRPGTPPTSTTYTHTMADCIHLSAANTVLVTGLTPRTCPVSFLSSTSALA